MLKGKHITLRKLRKSDFPYLHQWINDSTIRRFWYGEDRPRSKQWVNKHFTSILTHKNPSQCWIIEVKAKPIGFMYNTPEKNDDGEFLGRVELDIMIGNKIQWGKGYGTDALKTMINYAFTTQKAERVYMTPRDTNTRAIHVYQKAGFKKEGIMRHFEKFEGKWINCLMMAIIKDEFKP